MRSYAAKPVLSILSLPREPPLLFPWIQWLLPWQATPWANSHSYIRRAALQMQSLLTQVLKNCLLQQVRLVPAERGILPLCRAPSSHGRRDHQHNGHTRDPDLQQPATHHSRDALSDPVAISLVRPKTVRHMFLALRILCRYPQACPLPTQDSLLISNSLCMMLAVGTCSPSSVVSSWEFSCKSFHDRVCMAGLCWEAVAHSPSTR